MTVNRSDFQKGRLASVSAADTIIVNDEDGTLEPQVIDFAGLAASAPFTGAFWPNSSTALTGAGLANDDRIPVLDGSVPKYITADELAQMPQLSSRYVPLASDRLSLTPSQFIPILNTPAQGTLGNSSSSLYRVGALLFDDTADEAAAASFIWPVGWTTCKVYLWWSPATAGSGDCRWEIRLLSLSDAGNSDANGNAETHNATAPAQYTVKRTGGTTAYSGTAGQWTRLTVRRYGSGVQDTLTGDSGLIGVELVRES